MEDIQQQQHHQVPQPVFTSSNPPHMEVRSDSDSKMDLGTSAIHQATIRVNSLSISETPALRKRNREDEDHSFRVDKMSENPAMVPRSQAVLPPEDYRKQQQQHQSASQGTAPVPGLGREDSVTLMFPMFLPHSNSSGSNGSNSFINFIASQESFNAGADGGAQNSSSVSPTQGVSGTDSNSNSAFPGFKPGQYLPIPGNQSALPTFPFVSGSGGFPLGTGQGQSQNLLTQSLSSQLQSQNSTMSLSSQPSLNLGTGLSASGPSALGLGQLGGASTSSLGLGGSTTNLGIGGSNLLGLNIGGVMGMQTIGIPQTGGFQPGGSFLGFTTMAQPGGFETYMGDLRPRFDQATATTATGASQGFFPFSPYNDGNLMQQQQSSTKRSATSNGSKTTKKAGKSKNVGLSSSGSQSGDKYVSWSPEQERELVEAVEELGTDDWEAIAARIPGAHRTSAQCLRHWENKLSPNIKRGQWSAEEDEALRALVERAAQQGLGLLDIPWEDIKPHIPGRTLKQVRERWRSNLDPNIVRGDWSPEEDEMIIKMRDEQGMGWAAIARALKGRTEHSVKTRHRSMQRAKRRVWTEKEDRTIIEMVQAGSDFSTIANELKNRTAASVELRWNDLRAHA